MQLFKLVALLRAIYSMFCAVCSGFCSPVLLPTLRFKELKAIQVSTDLI